MRQLEESITTTTTRQGYQPKTLTDGNRARILYLPLFPTIYSDVHQPLLLANVSGKDGYATNLAQSSSSSF